jgi:lipoic acid synthetase
MGLRYVVITSVTRDDLADGGAAHVAATVREVKALNPGLAVEVLIPDFGGSEAALKCVLESGPDVLNHNIETVPRLYPSIRPQAVYQRSLDLIASVKRMAPGMKTKSGLMVGLGETRDEVFSVLADLRMSGCEIVTIGQYLQPSSAQAPVREFVDPALFAAYEAEGQRLGFTQTVAGPFVRSSYRASEVFDGTEEHVVETTGQRKQLDSECPSGL